MDELDWLRFRLSVMIGVRVVSGCIGICGGSLGVSVDVELFLGKIEFEVVIKVVGSADWLEDEI